LPGWSDLGGSIAYSGEDGVLLGSGDTDEPPYGPTYSAGDGDKPPYGPTYRAGDVVGCGVDFVNGHIFFTKNGEFLGGRVPDSLKKRFFR